MIWLSVALFAAATQASACADFQPTKAAQPAPRDARWNVVARARAKLLVRDRGGIVLIGDSIAARWPVDLQLKQFGKRFINLGIGGDRTENVLFRMGLYDLKAAAPPAVLIIVGTNDLRTAASPQSIAGNIMHIARWAIGILPSTPIYVSEVLPRGKNLMFKARDIRCINDTLRANSSRMGFTVLNVHDLIARKAGPVLPGSMFDDTVHPNETGYSVLGEQLDRAMKHTSR